MRSSDHDWTHLNSRNERLANAGDTEADPAEGRPGRAPRLATRGAGTHSTRGARTTGGACIQMSYAVRVVRAARAAAVGTVTVLAAGGSAALIPADAATTQQPPAVASSWRIVKTVHGAGGPSVTAVTASGPRSGWAFDAAITNGAKPAAWRLSRNRWVRAPFPGHSNELVTSAASTSADDVWAIASEGSQSRALRWNGSTWTDTGTIPRNIDDVVAVGTSDAWAFSNDIFPAHGGAWHYNGSNWSAISSGHGLISGSALSAGSIWAVGGTTVAHWNGHAWSRTSLSRLLPRDTELSHSSLTGVYAQSSGSVWAVGTGGREDEGGPVVVLHYNGHRWDRVALDRSYGTPAQAQVIPDGRGGLWIPVPGGDGRPFTMLHYSGGRLHSAALPLSASKLNVDALAAVPHRQRAIAGGASYRKNEPGIDQSAVILRY